MLQLVRASGIDPRRIIINVRAGTSMQGNQASLQQLRHIRAVLPTCVINIDPGPAPYERRRLERAVQIARAVGGRVMFPLDAQHVTPEAVRLLRAVGRVAIWNNPDRFDPGSIAAATARLRSIGVDGMIDLRRPNIGSRRRWNGASI